MTKNTTTLLYTLPVATADFIDEQCELQCLTRGEYLAKLIQDEDDASVAG